MSSGIKEHISEIIVEGHTDKSYWDPSNEAASYIYNLELSQERASSVVTYCMTDSNQVLTADEISYLQTVLSANGKSFSEMKDDDESSRRVEIKFRLADEGQIEKIIEMLSNENESQVN